MLHNQLPLDLSRLLIKRKNKESFEFTIHYHSLEFKPEDVSDKEINDLYKQLRGTKDTPGRTPQRKGSVPDADSATSNFTNPIPTSPKQNMRRQGSTISRRATVNDAIPVTQRLLDKEHMEILSNIDSLVEEAEALVTEVEDDELL